MTTPQKESLAPAPELDQDLADKVLATDLVNIVKKVKAGKPLSPTERKHIADSVQQRPDPRGGTLPRFSSMAHCAAVTGIPLSRLKAAKRGGCPGFDANGRVSLTQFLAWHFNQKGDSDMEANRARLTKAEADIRELERQERLGALVSRDMVAKFIAEAFLSVRQRLLAMPSEACARANPTDPQLAREALQRWVDESLPILRKELPK